MDVGLPNYTMPKRILGTYIVLFHAGCINKDNPPTNNFITKDGIEIKGILASSQKREWNECLSHWEWLLILLSTHF